MFIILFKFLYLSWHTSNHELTYITHCLSVHAITTVILSNFYHIYIVNVRT